MDKKITVLYICHTSNLGGAALSMYNMIHSLKDFITPIVLLPEIGQAFELLSAEGIKCILHPFRLNLRNQNLVIHYIKYFPHLLLDYYVNSMCINTVCKELGGQKIDIVHSNASVFTIGVKLAKILSARHIWHIREFQDLDFNIYPFSGWEKLKRQLYTADATIAITKAVFDHWGLNKAHNAYCLWNAVRSEDDVAFNKKKQKYFFHCAAILCDAKGTDFALEAFGRSGLAKEGYKLIMAGTMTEDYYSKLSHIIGKYKIEQNVEFIGYCTDVRKYMADATGFLMCSLNEGLGRVTVEAMFYGCPVIARNTGGTIEFVRDKETGFLFSDMDSCVAVMLKLAKRLDLDLIQSAQHFAVENFSEEKYGKKMIDVYKKVLESN